MQEPVGLGAPEDRRAVPCVVEPLQDNGESLCAPTCGLAKAFDSAFEQKRPDGFDGVVWGGHACGGGKGSHGGRDMADESRPDQPLGPEWRTRARPSRLTSLRDRCYATRPVASVATGFFGFRDHDSGPVAGKGVSMGILAMVGLALAVGFFVLWLGERGGKQTLLASAEASRKKDESTREEVTQMRRQLQDVEKKLADKTTSLSSLKEELSTTKRKLHDARQEKGKARQQAREPKEKAELGRALEDMREQLMAALEENARLRAGTTSGGEARARTSKAVEAPVAHTVALGAVAEESTADAGAAASAAPVANADVERLHRRIERLEDQKEQREARLKEFDARLAEERDKVRDEIRSLRKRLQRALKDADREKRRADNNDKAYRVLRAQLDAALDRLARFEGLRRPDALEPREERPESAPADEPASGDSIAVASAEPAPSEESAAEAPAAEAAPVTAAETNADDVTVGGETETEGADPQPEPTTPPPPATSIPMPPPAAAGVAVGDEDDDDWGLDEGTVAEVSGAHPKVES